jgi:probable HAF family extracellular repeat protein
MSSPISASIRRRGIAVIAAAVLVALAVACSAPAGVAGSASARPGKSGDTSFGFLLDRGRYQLIDLPGADVRGADGISALTGISNRGQIVGKANDTDGDGFYGLVGDRRGRFRRIDFPRALGTYANKIDERGRIVGIANRSAPDDLPGAFGYLLDRGRFTRIAYPGDFYTQALGINNRGQVAGGYFEINDRGEIVAHGFRWQNGRFTIFDGPPGTRFDEELGVGGASITDINDRGDMVGAYYAGNGTIRGFLLRKGRYTMFRALGLPNTVPLDINNRGQIAGTGIAYDAAGTPTSVHGFLLRKGADGPVTRIDVPGAPNTAVTGIDDRGRMVGFVDLRANAAPSAQRSRTAAMPLLDALPLGLDLPRLSATD